MASLSSPISYPKSSSPPPVAGVKRAERHNATTERRPAKPLVAGGFLIEDDSDDDEETQPPVSKRRMLGSVASEGAASLATAVLQHGTVSTSAQPAENLSTPPDSQPERFEVDSAEAASHPEDPTFDPGAFAPLFHQAASTATGPLSYRMSTCAGKRVAVHHRVVSGPVAYERMVAARSKTKEGRAIRTYYGIEMHELVGEARREMAEKRAARPPTPPEQQQQQQQQQHRDQPLEPVEVRQPDNKKNRNNNNSSSSSSSKKSSRRASMLWTEKYRARSFKDLVGDDMTNRQVLRWLKGWDPVVFPHATRYRPSAARRAQQQQQQKQQQQQQGQEQPEPEKVLHRKILLLAGPPGLGKTTLAHVCARQAGYEVLEINASDDRSSQVVRGRIRTTLGTENVRTVENGRTAAPKEKPRVARPVCVVVDEVDGAVTGSGGAGEGGFVKALLDLVLLSQRNAAEAGTSSQGVRRRKKGDDFRQMRPLILICNDVYHPALRPLRQSGLAEVVHAGKPTLEAIVTRLKAVFEQEGIPCEKDAARKVCEAAWGMASGIEAKKSRESTAEGDIRGVMVVGEWVATRLRAANKLPSPPCLTREWVQQNVMQELAHGGGGARGIGRGGMRDIVARIFQEGAGFPRPAAAAAAAASAKVGSKRLQDELPQAQLGFSEQQKKHAMERLRQMIETCGETDRVTTDIFSDYPNHEFNDDAFLSKPDAAYEWLHFHDSCSTRLYASQSWELGPYLSQTALACHHLFASSHRHVPPNAGYDRKWGADAAEAEAAAAPPLPFTGPRADFQAFEAERANRAALQAIQAQLPATLGRAFRSPEHVATDFLPYLVRLVSPDVKPVVVGGGADKAAVASVRREGEKAMVRRATEVLADVGIALQKGRIEDASRGAGPAARTQWVYRMEPDIDALATYETAGRSILGAQAPTRYAVRQVLDQELQRTLALRENSARQSRLRAGLSGAGPGLGGGVHVFDDKENARVAPAKQAKAAFGLSSVKRDFFGRVMPDAPRPLQDVNVNGGERRGKMEMGCGGMETKAWVTFHEGLNNAVKKPISLDEFLRGL